MVGKALLELLSIPSISTLQKHKKDINKAASFLAEYMKKIGLEHVKVMATGGHPVVYADWLHAKGKPTVLIYGHYDVQPPDPLDEWESPPFSPTIRKGNIYARGAADNKCQLFIHLKSAEILLKSQKRLPVNVKFLIEGEEEIGSLNLEHFIGLNKKRLKADFALISDTGSPAPHKPTIIYGLRGLLYTQISVQTAKHDLHSGSYGGRAENPVHILAKVITQLQDGQKITIPGFYDDVASPEKSSFKTRPSLDVNGIWGGFTGEGAKTIIPAKASAKISMRLVPHQEPSKIAKIFESYLQKITPDTATLSFQAYSMARPVLVDCNTTYMQKAKEAVKEVFGVRPRFSRTGGTIPVVEIISRVLFLQSILLGFGLDSDNIHAPNEKFSLKMFQKGIQTSTKFLEKLASLK